MLKKIPAAMFWSGGKDSSLALHRVLQQGVYEVRWLVTTLNSERQRITMHGVRKELLEQQAAAIGIPLKIMPVPQAPDNSAYETGLAEIFSFLLDEGVSHVIYGDIFLEDLKDYREKHLKAHHLTGIYPLWKEDTGALYNQFIEKGFKAITVAVNKPTPGRAFAGKVLDESFKEDLPDFVDPCGENGEFHTFVYDGPVFERPVAFEVGNTEIHSYKGSFEHEFYFTDLLPKNLTS